MKKCINFYSEAMFFFVNFYDMNSFLFISYGKKIDKIRFYPETFIWSLIYGKLWRDVWETDHWKRHLLDENRLLFGSFRELHYLVLTFLQKRSVDTFNYLDCLLIASKPSTRVKHYKHSACGDLHAEFKNKTRSFMLQSSVIEHCFKLLGSAIYGNNGWSNSSKYIVVLIKIFR